MWQNLFTYILRIRDDKKNVNKTIEKNLKVGMKLEFRHILLSYSHY